jgi:hypothetical protein
LGPDASISVDATGAVLATVKATLASDLTEADFFAL